MAWMSASLIESQTMLKSCERFIRTNWGEVQKSDFFIRILKENKISMLKLIASAIDAQKDTLLEDLLQ